VLEGKFASAFKPSAEGKPAAATPGLYEAVKKSAQAIGKRDVDLAHWFAAVDGSPVGPISARRIHQYQKEKQVTDDSLVWKEGLPDWVALRNCKELVGLVARIDLEDTGAISAGGSIVPRLGLFGAGPSQSASSPLRGYSVGVVGEYEALEVDVDAEVDADDDSKTRANVRISDALSFAGAKAGAAPSSKSGGEGSAEHSFFSSEEGQHVSLEPVTAGELHSLSPPRVAEQSRVVLISAVGLFLIALLLLVVMIMKPGQAGERIVTQTVEKVVEKVVYRDRPLSPTVRVDDEEDGAGNAKGKVKNRVGAMDKSAGTKGAQVDEKTRALLEQMGMGGGSGGPIGADKSHKQSGATGGGASALTAPQIKSVVDRNRGALQNCYVRSLKQGDAPSDRDIRINFNLNVGTSGMVKKIGMSGEGSGNAALRSCLTKSIQKWVFPPAGSESPVEFPILFSPR
jgi:hypothetical protein